METSENQICHLCFALNKPMHGRSHIIPVSFFGRMERKGKGDLLLVSPESFKKDSLEGKEYIPPSIHPRHKTPFDTGWYCIECEKLFGKHDNISAKFLVDRENLRGGKFATYDVGDGNVRGQYFNHRHAWKWQQFLLSLVYRMHMSEHEQYSAIKIDSKWLGVIREIIMKDEYDKRIDLFDILTMLPNAENADTSRDYSAPTFQFEEKVGEFSLLWCAWGIWFFVSYPKNSQLKSFPRCLHSKETILFYIMEVSLGYTWLAHYFVDDISLIKDS